MVDLFYSAYSTITRRSFSMAGVDSIKPACHTTAVYKISNLLDVIRRTGDETEGENATIVYKPVIHQAYIHQSN